MAVIGTDSTRFSAVVKFETEPQLSVCRESITIYGADTATYVVGAVLGKITTGAATSAAKTGGNTGNGTMGAVTVGAAGQVGVYTLRITAAAANAGSFNVIDPQGDIVGQGTVAVAFSGGGLSFTLADGSTDFIVGDGFDITVAAGSGKYTLLNPAATNGSQTFAGIYIADVMGSSSDLAVTASTDTKALILARGPAIVAKEALSYHANVDTDGEKDTIYAAMKAVGIHAEASL